MSAEENTSVEEKSEAVSSDLKLEALFAFKEGMSTVFDEEGRAVNVTVLSYKPWRVSQIKTKERDGYEAVQIACSPKKAKRSTKAEVGHLKKAGFENGAHFVKEVRQSVPEGAKEGATVSIESLVKGDRVRLTAQSRGRGFAGVMKRHGFGGGPAAHGSGFHRRPGSVGNCEFPGRVMPGRKMPGHYGMETVTIKNVEIVDVLPEENILLVKGSVPGSKNTMVKLIKA